MTDDAKDFIVCPGCGAPIPIKILNSLYVCSFASTCECGWRVSGTKIPKTEGPTPLSRAAKKRAKREVLKEKHNGHASLK